MTHENVTVSSSSTEKTSTDDIHISVKLDQLEIKPIELLPSSLVDMKTNGITTDDVGDQTPSPLSSPIKLEKSTDNGVTVIEKDSSTDIPSEYFYDFQLEHFPCRTGQTTFSIIF